jgi:hypothetical protein
MVCYGSCAKLFFKISYRFERKADLYFFCLGMNIFEHFFTKIVFYYALVYHSHMVSYHSATFYSPKLLIFKTLV